MGHTNKNKKKQTKNKKQKKTRFRDYRNGGWQLGAGMGNYSPPRSLRIFVFLLFGFGAHVFDF